MNWAFWENKPNLKKSPVFSAPNSVVSPPPLGHFSQKAPSMLRPEPLKSHLYCNEIIRSSENEASMKTYKMLTTTLILLTALCWGGAQTRLLYQVSVNFPAFGLPGYRLSENFRNLGFSAGITYPFNQNETTGLRLDMGYYRTRAQGSSLYVQSQFSLHPRIGDKLEAGIDLGAGYQIVGAASPGLVRDTEGQWQKQNNQKGLFFVPAGLHLGYRINNTWRPFVQYQTQVLLGYNEAFPVFPVHLLTLGQTFKF